MAFPEGRGNFDQLYVAGPQKVSINWIQLDAIELQSFDQVYEPYINIFQNDRLTCKHKKWIFMGSR